MMRDPLSTLASVGLAALLAGAALAPPVAAQPRAAHLDAGFRLLYETRFAPARAEFARWETVYPDDPLGPAAEAASYLYEEFYRQGVFTSEFFLDDKKLLGGVGHGPDPARRAAFLENNRRAEALAQRRLKANPNDPEALFALTITAGMQADYASLIEKRHLETVKFIRQAEADAGKLLAAQPDAQDAYLALGAAHYIIACLPAYKRALLWLGGLHGDRQRGMNELAMAAAHGNYLRPFAKVMLALAAEREKQPELARKLFTELAAEFPENPIFPRELAKIGH